VRSPPSSSVSLTVGAPPSSISEVANKILPGAESASDTASPANCIYEDITGACDPMFCVTPHASMLPITSPVAVCELAP